MKSKLRITLSAMIWALILVAAYVVAHTPKQIEQLTRGRPGKSAPHKFTAPLPAAGLRDNQCDSPASRQSQQ